MSHIWKTYLLLPSFYYWFLPPLFGQHRINKLNYNARGYVAKVGDGFDPTETGVAFLLLPLAGQIKAVETGRQLLFIGGYRARAGFTHVSVTKKYLLIHLLLWSWILINQLGLRRIQRTALSIKIIISNIFFLMVLDLENSKLPYPMWNRDLHLNKLTWDATYFLSLIVSQRKGLFCWSGKELGMKKWNEICKFMVN